MLHGKISQHPLPEEAWNVDKITENVDKSRYLPSVGQSSYSDRLIFFLRRYRVFRTDSGEMPRISAICRVGTSIMSRA